MSPECVLRNMTDMRVRETRLGIEIADWLVRGHPSTATTLHCICILCVARNLAAISRHRKSGKPTRLKRTLGIGLHNLIKGFDYYLGQDRGIATSPLLKDCYVSPKPYPKSRPPDSSPL
jgi:hypothetical protein